MTLIHSLANDAAPGRLTGCTVDAWGHRVPEVEVSHGALRALHRNDYAHVVEVDGVSYYVADCGGIWVGSQVATGRDSGGNVYKTRTAPANLGGICTGAGAIHMVVGYGDPEIAVKYID